MDFNVTLVMYSLLVLIVGMIFGCVCSIGFVYKMAAKLNNSKKENSDG